MWYGTGMGALWLAGSGLAGLVLQPQLEEHPTAAQQCGGVVDNAYQQVPAQSMCVCHLGAQLASNPTAQSERFQLTP